MSARGAYNSNDGITFFLSFMVSRARQLPRSKGQTYQLDIGIFTQTPPLLPHDLVAKPRGYHDK